MNHSELIRRLSDKLDIPRSESRMLVRETIAECISQLGGGNGFTIPGLGTFKTKQRGARKMYNPSAGIPMMVPPRRTVTFSPGKKLKHRTRSTGPDE